VEGQSASAEGVSADYISHYNAMKAVIDNNANSAVKIFSRCFDFFCSEVIVRQPAKNVCFLVLRTDPRGRPPKIIPSGIQFRSLVTHHFRESGDRPLQRLG